MASTNRPPDAPRGSPAVRAWEENVTIPTYWPGPPERNALFLERRVNQGTSGRVYPNRFIGELTSRKADRTYRAVFLENEYLWLMILPEIGGRIHAALDKTNGYDFIYRQHVIKPALIGLLGPWISGGMEFNWPMHHRPSTFMPVDYFIESHPCGAKTVWLGEHEPMWRTKGMVGVHLRPGQARFETRVQLFNRTAWPQSFLWWVNAAVHVNDQYQLVFPPDVTYVTDHSKRAMCHYPIAREEYYGHDFNGVDISWCRNHPVASSYFASESRYDFFGGYDHGRRAGIIHVANHHIAPGKKLFTWGTGQFGRAWCDSLTDEDGPYIELMAGVYTDNQPDFSWLMPYEMRTFSQCWYPVQQIGPAKNATDRVAVNLEVQKGRVRAAAYATERIEQATVRLLGPDKSLLERTVDLAPGSPFVEEFDLPAGVGELDLRLCVLDRDGREIIRHQPEAPEDKPLPAPARPPEPPETFKSNEELFLAGLHLKQYYHPSIAPEPYWQEALRRDSLDSRSRNALGLSCLHRGLLDEAAEHFRQAIRRLTERNLNPYDGEPFYNLGVVLKYQARLDEAAAAFHKAAWNQPWQAPAYYALAEIDCIRGELGGALEHLELSLAANGRNLKARDLKAAVLRRLGRLAEAEALAGGTLELDPLNFRSLHELVLAAEAGGQEALADQRRRQLHLRMEPDTQLALDAAFDYASSGLWAEAQSVLEDCPVRQDDAMVLYVRAHLCQAQGLAGQAEKLRRQAASTEPDGVWAVRLEEMLVLQQALEADADDARAHYYLGNLLYDKRRYDEAVEHWEAHCRLDGRLSVGWRNLGLAMFNVRRDVAAARDCYRCAMELASDDPRLLLEASQLARRACEPPRERLERLIRCRELVWRSDDLVVELAGLYNVTGEPDKALELLGGREFHPCEGGEGRASSHYVAAHLLLGRAALDRGAPAEALEHFEAAWRYPPNLHEGPDMRLFGANVMYYTGLAHKLLGQWPAAAEAFRRCADWSPASSAQAAGGQSELSPAAYYQALALRELGDEAACRRRLEELLHLARAGCRQEASQGFATSIASFSVFSDDRRTGRLVHCGHLVGLACLGLGRSQEAKAALEEVLALDASHLGASQELRRL